MIVAGMAVTYVTLTFQQLSVPPKLKGKSKDMITSISSVVFQLSTFVQHLVFIYSREYFVY